MYLNKLKKICLLLIFCISFGSIGAQQNQKDNIKNVKFTLSMQTWTFNKFTFVESLDKIKSLGLTQVEFYFGQTIGGGIEGTMDFKMSTEKINAIKKILKEKGINAIACGVVIPEKKEEWKTLFEFAKAIELTQINTEPDPNLLPMIDKLANEYAINVGIHNHPAPSSYYNPDETLDKLKGISNRIGFCLDIGHLVRSGLDPLFFVKALNKKIKSFHFKDVKDKNPETHDVIWGKGQCKIYEILKELEGQDYKGFLSIEYEYNWDNSIPDIKECIDSYYNLLNKNENENK